MPNNRFMYYWLAWFAATTLAYQYVQDSLRPGYTGSNPSVKYLLGVAPNFFPAVGLPALFVVLLPYIITGLSKLSLLLRYPPYTANLISLSGLLVWEFAQTFSSRGHFDWNDVLFTLLGGLVFHGIWILSPQKGASHP
jgi:hypothetical protein